MRNALFMVFALVLSAAAHAADSKEAKDDWVDPPQTPVEVEYAITCVKVFNNGTLQGLLFVSREDGPMTQVIGANGAPATCNASQSYPKRN